MESLFPVRIMCASAVVVFTGLLLLKTKETEGQHQCKSMMFLPGSDNSYLRHHVIESVIAESQTLCRLRCYLHEGCLSYNYRALNTTCELSQSDHLRHPGDLIKLDGYVYTSTANPCSSSPCTGNIVCEPDFNTGSYACLCPLGFGGPSCADIDECATGTHNCSERATCNNTHGTFQCVCSHGFEGDGVICNDTDECTSGTHGCPEYSICQNTEGSFNCNCNAGYQKNNSECVRMLAEYVITVYTTDVWQGGTDAKVFIKIYGAGLKANETGELELGPGTFESGDEEQFTITEQPNMDSLSRVYIRHDNTGFGPAWHLDKVIIDNKAQKVKYEFKCGCWLEPSADLNRSIVTQY